ncbi:hypothetical protein [Luteimonas sp. SDU101]|uniref:hypothetical protein n=1 Tax=Luteimonas sp. SDU101 TaxID=3422593 RepID=UPI003EB93A42
MSPRGPLLAMVLGMALAPGAGAGALQDAPAQVDAQAQPTGTGSAWIDARLRDMDRYAAQHREAFADEIVRYLDAPRPLVEEALADGRMRAGDLYYACALARAAGQPCRALVEAWRANAGLGWEAVLAQLQLAEDARPNARIREDIVASYRRWARPIDVEVPPGA